MMALLGGLLIGWGGCQLIVMPNPPADSVILFLAGLAVAMYGLFRGDL